MQNINLEHPEYVAKAPVWRKYRDLYVGGEQLKTRAAEHLTQRQKEPADVYGERLSRVFYENYVGSIIDWYAATLFRREPQLHVVGENRAGRDFFNQFSEDCDRKGTNMSDFFRRQFIESLVTGCSYVLVDFPRSEESFGTRAAEDASGVSRAYLVEFPSESLINWGHDERGNYEWVVLRCTYTKRDSNDPSKTGDETIWRYYDRQQYKLYRKGPEKDAVIELVDSGFHALASQSRVPLFSFQVSEGLWLMNKAGLVQMEHFNKSNALSWALTMGLFASPVVYSDRPWNQIVGESYFIQLGPDDKFGWTEPEGRVYQIASDNLCRLQEEIYRVCYVTSQGQNGLSSNAAQSGLSKLRDFAITQEVLRAYGDFVKDGMKRLLRAIEFARCDGLQIDVSGLDDFDIRDFTSDLDEAERLLKIGIDSPTLKKQVFRKLAYKYLSDVRQEVKDQISQEIDASIDLPAE